MMQDRFQGKTWIFWVQLLLFGWLGVFGVVMGPLFWMGMLRKADGSDGSDAGPPLTIIGSCLLMAAMLAAFNIISRLRPIIGCYREGIECNLIGATSLDDVPLVPGLVRVAWTILSLQGFRSQCVRIPWSEFRGAQVTGMPMAYVVSLKGTLTNLTTGHKSNGVDFPQVTLVDDPQLVANTLNLFASNPPLREHLPRGDFAATAAAMYR